MRRLKRAYQKNAKKQRKLSQKAITAGTVAAITLGSAGLNKAIARSSQEQPRADEHQLPLRLDADTDLLRDTEEFAIGYKPFDSDQNKTEIPDGVELAKRAAAVIENLPTYISGTDMLIPNEPYKIPYLMHGLERCDICGQTVNMGGYEIVNPRINMSFPDPNDSLECLFLPELAIHYMSHGSFDCFGDIHQGRTDIARLMRVLELRFPYQPNDHQLPVDGNDLDGDLLTDSEELAAGYNLYDPDQNENLIPDGVDLAQQCATAIRALPEVDSNGPEIIHAIYKESFMQRGLEYCDICGTNVNMGYWLVTNARLGLSIEVPVIVLHYMRHGSFSYAGDVHRRGRIDVALLAKILEMPYFCGDMGTIYAPADINKDCRVDNDDLLAFIRLWLSQSTENQD